MTGVRTEDSTLQDRINAAHLRFANLHRQLLSQDGPISPVPTFKNEMFSPRSPLPRTVCKGRSGDKQGRCTSTPVVKRQWSKKYFGRRRNSTGSTDDFASLGVNTIIYSQQDKIDSSVVFSRKGIETVKHPNPLYKSLLTNTTSPVHLSHGPNYLHSSVSTPEKKVNHFGTKQDLYYRKPGGLKCLLDSNDYFSELIDHPAASPARTFEPTHIDMSPPISKIDWLSKSTYNESLKAFFGVNTPSSHCPKKMHRVSRKVKNLFRFNIYR